MFHKAFIIFIFSILFISNLQAESDIDQWQDSDKTYKDLIEEGFEVKAYDTSTLQTANGLTLMFFVTVLQKGKEVYELMKMGALDSMSIGYKISPDGYKYDDRRKEFDII